MTLLFPLFYSLAWVASLTPGTYVLFNKPLELGYSNYFDGYILTIDPPKDICRFYDLKGRLVFDVSFHGAADKVDIDQFGMRFEAEQEQEIKLFIGEEHRNRPLWYQRLVPLEASEVSILEDKEALNIIENDGHYFWPAPPRGFIRPVLKITDSYLEYQASKRERYFFQE